MTHEFLSGIEIEECGDDSSGLRLSANILDGEKWFHADIHQGGHPMAQTEFTEEEAIKLYKWLQQNIYPKQG